MIPYYDKNGVTIYNADCRDVFPSLSPVDAIVADPPYAETSLKWDRWPDLWPSLCTSLSNNLWCFGSFRMFLERSLEFSSWTLAQDIIWEKHNGTNCFNDRFRRVHEMAVHFYRGQWKDLYKKTVFTNDATKKTVRRKTRPPQWGEIGESSYESQDGGPRMQRSVIYCRSCHGSALHPTQKPDGIILPLLEFSVPPGGTVLDPFCGSGSTLFNARNLGLRSIGIEVSEEYCEIAAKRLDAEVKKEAA